jgi:glucan biosynthesis protein
MSGNVATGNVRKILESRFCSGNNKMWLIVTITPSPQGDQPMLPLHSGAGRSLWDPSDRPATFAPVTIWHRNMAGFGLAKDGLFLSRQPQL